MTGRRPEPVYLELLPAVDVAGGRVVQAARGEPGASPLDDPIQAALRWQADGAEWIHLVDLDAAFGRGHNRELLASVVGAIDIDVEVSGGVHDDVSLAAAIDTGCRRVVLGTAALEDRAWCAHVIAEYGDRVAVALDVRGRALAARGGNRDGGDVFEALSLLDEEGCARYVVTDVDADGTLSGPNLQLLRSVCDATSMPVIASGGVADLSDVGALATLVPLGLEGTIVGTALYDGRFRLTDALRHTRERPTSGTM